MLALNGWHARACANRRDKLLRRLIVGRAILPEGERPHRTTHRECPQENLDGGKGRRIHTHVLVEQNAVHLTPREDRPGPVGSEQEVGRLRYRGFELSADLFQHRRRALGGEHTGRHDISRRDPRLPGSGQPLDQRFAVRLQGGVLGLAEVQMLAEVCECL